ncbi:Cyclin-domain-containing protein [Mycena indigotica]|uniref:Cyclin-domain-containing protein n=1 Tax=Mycena indigotica TaxID=2126181 RepID=A0A8H6W6Y2_9AGAR|nr:Cyclin-domain-containing protein [Mycena indigotica]KAF7301569.1 Cyclin-domain-containing protein [Mycena indigotica]
MGHSASGSSKLSPFHISLIQALVENELDMKHRRWGDLTDDHHQFPHDNLVPSSHSGSQSRLFLLPDASYDVVNGKVLPRRQTLPDIGNIIDAPRLPPSTTATFTVTTSPTPIKEEFSSSITTPSRFLHLDGSSRSSSIGLVSYDNEPGELSSGRATKRARLTPGTDDELLLPSSPRKTLGGTKRLPQFTEDRAETSSEASTHGLEDLLSVEPAPIGAIRSGLSMNRDGAKTMIQQMGAQPGRQTKIEEILGRPYVRARRTPAAEYLERLEDWFGPGDPLRGEEEPDDKPDEPDKEREMNDRAQQWISQIQMVAKGKKTLTREDMRILSESLHEIAYMSSTTAETIKNHLPKLLHSLEHLALVDIPPDQDEFKVIIWARNLVKNWPR